MLPGSGARSLRPDGLVGISDAVRQQANEMVRRTTERRWEDLIDDALLIAEILRETAEVAYARGEQDRARSVLRQSRESFRGLGATTDANRIATRLTLLR